MPEENPRPPQSESEEPSVPEPATRPVDTQDAPPPMVSPARGPMNQTVPDVPTGSTPLTRHDD